MFFRSLSYKYTKSQSLLCTSIRTFQLTEMQVQKAERHWNYHGISMFHSALSVFITFKTPPKILTINPLKSRNACFLREIICHVLTNSALQINHPKGPSLPHYIFHRSLILQSTTLTYTMMLDSKAPFPFQFDKSALTKHIFSIDSGPVYDSI